MTEAEWLAATHPAAMLAFLGDRASERKLVLFACWCAWRVWRLLDDPRWQRAVEVAERYAEGDALASEFRAAVGTAYRGGAGAGPIAALPMSIDGLGVALAADHCALMVGRDGPEGEGDSRAAAERAAQAGVIRDLFPYRPADLDPDWLTPDVLAIAQAIHRDRAFADLPLLADALEDAGCTSEEILGHLRGPGPHVRGCWALDPVLGKE
jgi:hypothetical protein